MAPSLEVYEDVVASLPVNGKPNITQAVSIPKLETDETHDYVLRVFRCLIADLCEQFKGGHPG